MRHLRRTWWRPWREVILLDHCCFQSPRTCVKNDSGSVCTTSNNEKIKLLAVWEFFYVVFSTFKSWFYSLVILVWDLIHDLDWKLLFAQYFDHVGISMSLPLSHSLVTKSDSRSCCSRSNLKFKSCFDKLFEHIAAISIFIYLIL